MILTSLFIVLGLIVFEAVNSVDNAIINAHILKTMRQKWRQRFLFVGILTSVVLIRLVLPLMIVSFVIQNVPVSEIVKMFTGSTLVADAVENQKSLILIFGGVFLTLLYVHWLFMEKKVHLFYHEKLLKEYHRVWFFAFAATFLAVLLYFARYSPNMMLFASIGSAVFFIVYGFKETAEKQEEKLISWNASDMSKFIYLEVLDATFSFDGVIGAFAFTTNILLIFIGLGIGALIVRELTIRGINTVSKYKFLKNGAMTSIGILGLFMILESFGLKIPLYLPPVITFLSVGYAFYVSHKGLTIRI